MSQQSFRYTEADQSQTRVCPSDSSASGVSVSAESRGFVASCVTGAALQIN